MMEYDFADCSTLGHYWSRNGRKSQAGGNVTVIYECGRCHKKRHDTFNLRGLYIIARRYENPPGYKAPPKGEAITRSEWREIYLKRLLKRSKL